MAPARRQQKEDKVCPLCIEVLDATERSYYPCPCGYQICLFCLDRLKQDCGSLCPGCRTQYGSNHDPFKKRSPAAASVSADSDSSLNTATISSPSEPRLNQQPQQQQRTPQRAVASSAGTHASQQQQPRSQQPPVHSQPLATSVAGRPMQRQQSQQPVVQPIAVQSKRQDRRQAGAAQQTAPPPPAPTKRVLAPAPDLCASPSRQATARNAHSAGAGTKPGLALTTSRVEALPVQPRLVPLKLAPHPAAQQQHHVQGGAHSQRQALHQHPAPDAQASPIPEQLPLPLSLQGRTFSVSGGLWSPSAPQPASAGFSGGTSLFAASGSGTRLVDSFGVNPLPADASDPWAASLWPTADGATSRGAAGGAAVQPPPRQSRLAQYQMGAAASTRPGGPLPGFPAAATPQQSHDPPPPQQLSFQAPLLGHFGQLDGQSGGLAGQHGRHSQQHSHHRQVQQQPHAGGWGGESGVAVVGAPRQRRRAAPLAQLPLEGASRVQPLPGAVAQLEAAQHAVRSGHVTASDAAWRLIRCLQSGQQGGGPPGTQGSQDLRSAFIRAS